MGVLKKKDLKASSTSPCALLRAAYHDCFNRWYSEKFVKGKWDKEECLSEWQKYRACLSEHLEDKHLKDSSSIRCRTVVYKALVSAVNIYLEVG
ncbi:phosphatase [Thalictrum thalictroides]|uniref:Phosphatase n=1 Tax=Thalictrum thalictroides TaxID=46969 RepID=A0A7J6VQF5_THATH|nr:phosphatase [Thalictrum thalictroides]